MAINQDFPSRSWQMCVLLKEMKTYLLDASYRTHSSTWMIKVTLSWWEVAYLYLTLHKDSKQILVKFAHVFAVLQETKQHRAILRKKKKKTLTFWQGFSMSDAVHHETKTIE